jgi:hypothetical protein
MSELDQSYDNQALVVATPTSMVESDNPYIDGEYEVIFDGPTYLPPGEQGDGVYDPPDWTPPDTGSAFDFTSERYTQGAMIEEFLLPESFDLIRQKEGW